MTLPIQDLENRLWATADQLRANSELTSAEYKSPVLGLVFLRFVDQKFQAAKEPDYMLSISLRKRNWEPS